MSAISQKRKKGFTLVETLAAGVLLALSVVVICAISTRSLSRVGLNQEYQSAWQVLDRQLTMIEYLGVDTFYQESESQGSTISNGKTFLWESEIEPDEMGRFFRVRMKVSWAGQDASHQVSAVTYMYRQ